MKGFATELIHAGEAGIGTAVPLTTPIYETSTFVFENAAEVLAYNEGRSSKYLYSRYANPTIVSVERKLAALEQAQSALLHLSFLPVGFPEKPLQLLRTRRFRSYRGLRIGQPCQGLVAFRRDQ